MLMSVMKAQMVVLRCAQMKLVVTPAHVVLAIV